VQGGDIQPFQVASESAHFERGSAHLGDGKHLLGGLVENLVGAVRLVAQGAHEGGGLVAGEFLFADFLGDARLQFGVVQFQQATSVGSR
jgi:hypothetical protein